ncbi:MAG: ATP-dependent DNA helicase UvrD2 [Acidimicrobiales bacterium]|nr:ATP-dependent DNA helicase UvrD2 [Acidimicrobiales bacterium]
MRLNLGAGDSTPAEGDIDPFGGDGLSLDESGRGDRNVESLLAGLNDEQHRAVTHDAGHLCIIAGAGSGKTRVLTRRIAHRSLTGAADPRKVLTLTFTRKAAGELTNRLRSLGMRDSVAAGTFHGIAYAQLRSRWSDLDRTAPELLDRKVGFVARLLPRGRKGGLQAIELVGEIEWAKARRIRPAEYETGVHRLGRKPPAPAGQIAELYGRYEKQKAQRHLIDFDDLLILARREIEADPAYAAAQHWRRQHLFVDEFQDVNPLQFALLQAWMGPESDLCVVGDPRQAIYGWNGADSAYLDEFCDLFPTGRTVELKHNHRSSPQILTMANAVLGHKQQLIPTRPSGPLPVSRSFVNDYSEARGVARAVRDARRPGARWAEQAVLMRTNAQLQLFEEAFRKAKIPFRSRGGMALLDRPEVKASLRQLRSGRTSLEVALADLDDQARRLGGDLTESEQPQLVADAGDADDEDAPSADGSQAIEERRANLLTLVRMGNDYLAIDPSGDIERFVSWLRTAVGGHTAEYEDAVELATFHSAKGLEWPIVHLAGLEEGLVPIGYAKTRAARNEERNLMYVALTRAERQLFLSWAEQRSVGKRTANRTPSPYLVTIDETIALVASGRPLDDVLDRIAEQRKVLAKNRPAKGPRGKQASSVADSDPRFVALKEWRLTTARAADVPAFVVFNDATLKAIVETNPTTKEGLLSVSGIGPVKANRYGDEVLRVLGSA